MDILNLMQDLSPVQVMVSMLLLPWLAVAFMHAASSVAYCALDDNFSLRALAALRWAQVPAPVAPTPMEALAHRARSAVQVKVTRRAESTYFEHEAA